MSFPPGTNLSGEGVCIPRFNPFFTKLEEVRVLAQDAFDNAWLALSLINAGKNGIKIFDTAADAAAFSFPDQAVLVYCQGLATSTDRAGGFWLYDPNSAAAANTYDCLITTSVDGRLIKQL